MKVVVAINGSMVAESTAMLAMRYAKAQSVELLILHVKNHKDNLEHVHESAERIIKQADLEEVRSELVVLKGHIKDILPSFLESFYVDTFFCSSRIAKRFITNSFSEHVLKMGLNMDIAVVRIVNVNSFKTLDSILLPIKEAKLSVKKFTFFATLAATYECDSEIYSISVVRNSSLARYALSVIKEKFLQINFELRHYKNLANLLPFTLRIKHEISTNETKSILTHMARSECQLVVLGAKRFTFFSRFRNDAPIEALLRESSKNVIAYYPKED